MWKEAVYPSAGRSPPSLWQHMRETVPMVEEIAPTVLVQEGSEAHERSSLVCGRDVCVLIDSPRHFAEADELVDAASSRCMRGVTTAIITHGHLDQVATLQAFPLAAVVGTEAAREYMAGEGQRRLERLRVGDLELERVVQVMPTVALSSEATVYLDDGRSLRCMPLPGHSADSMLVLLEPEHILFAGDALGSLYPPHFADGSSLQLQQSISRITEIRPTLLVPAHGPVLGEEQVLVEAEASIQYLSAVRRLVRDGVRSGARLDELRQRIRWEDCSQKPRPPAHLLALHEENVMCAAAEVSPEAVPAAAR